jgi:hypothetical protein
MKPIPCLAWSLSGKNIGLTVVEAHQLQTNEHLNVFAVFRFEFSRDIKTEHVMIYNLEQDDRGPKFQVSN